MSKINGKNPENQKGEFTNKTWENMKTKQKFTMENTEIKVLKNGHLKKKKKYWENLKMKEIYKKNK